jgi:hypothetical protein
MSGNKRRILSRDSHMGTCPEIKVTCPKTKEGLNTQEAVLILL